MLTGPVTILYWSFPREDVSRETIAKQIALALRDEVDDLQKASIGGPSTSIAVEELAQLGIRRFLHIGTTGAIQENINVGDVLVTAGAVRLDGASQPFAHLEYPAVADFTCTNALYDAAKEAGATSPCGRYCIVRYFLSGQERLDTYTGQVMRHFKGSMKEWQDMWVMNYEMESATLLTMCPSQGLRAGMVAGVIVNRTQQEIPDESLLKKVKVVY